MKKIPISGIEVQPSSRPNNLNSVKMLANIALAGCVVLFLVARRFSHFHPAFGFVAAFAEAAVIGGLADWYAVVAFFRRPLGLPIPHTAIIQKNQYRIADGLGQFIEDNFLVPQLVEVKLREIDFASFILSWISDQEKSDRLSRFILRVLPDALAVVESSKLEKFIIERIVDAIKRVNAAPFVAGMLRTFVQEGHHKVLLDDLLLSGHRLLGNSETLQMIRERLRKELPALLRIYYAEEFLIKKIGSLIGGFIEEVLSNPDHPFRGEVESFLLSFSDKFENYPTYVSRIEEIKLGLLARPELSQIGRQIWESFRNFIQVNSSDSGTSQLQRQLGGAIVSVGRSLKSDRTVQMEINDVFVMILQRFIGEQAKSISGFISDQVKSWDIQQLISTIEQNVGKDLQYIRFNGMIIGGLVGMLLYTVEQLVGIF